MRFSPILIPLCLPAIASAALATPSSDISWGKAGVSLEQYARDANECADTSRYVTTYIKPKTLRQLDGLSSAQLLDTVQEIGLSPEGNAMNIVSAITKLRSADDIASRSNTFGAKYVAMARNDVEEELQLALNRCLIERGYVKIGLTKYQRHNLSHLKQQSAERTAYLHSIDSDPASIARQRLEPAAP